MKKFLGLLISLFTATILTMTASAFGPAEGSTASISYDAGTKTLTVVNKDFTPPPSESGITPPTPASYLDAILKSCNSSLSLEQADVDKIVFNSCKAFNQLRNWNSATDANNNYSLEFNDCDFTGCGNLTWKVGDNKTLKIKDSSHNNGNTFNFSGTGAVEIDNLVTAPGYYCNITIAGANSIVHNLSQTLTYLNIALNGDNSTIEDISCTTTQNTWSSLSVSKSESIIQNISGNWRYTTFTASGPDSIIQNISGVHSNTNFNASGANSKIQDIEGTYGATSFNASGANSKILNVVGNYSTTTFTAGGQGSQIYDIEGIINGSLTYNLNGAQSIAHGINHTVTSSSAFYLRGVDAKLYDVEGTYKQVTVQTNQSNNKVYNWAGDYQYISATINGEGSAFYKVTGTGQYITLYLQGKNSYATEISGITNYIDISLNGEGANAKAINIGDAYFRTLSATQANNTFENLTSSRNPRVLGSFNVNSNTSNLTVKNVDGEFNLNCGSNKVQTATFDGFRFGTFQQYGDNWTVKNCHFNGNKIQIGYSAGANSSSQNCQILAPVIDYNSAIECYVYGKNNTISNITFTNANGYFRTSSPFWGKGNTISGKGSSTSVNENLPRWDSLSTIQGMANTIEYFKLNSDIRLCHNSALDLEGGYYYTGNTLRYCYFSTPRTVTMDQLFNNTLQYCKNLGNVQSAVSAPFIQNNIFNDAGGRWTYGITLVAPNWPTGSYGGNGRGYISDNTTGYFKINCALHNYLSNSSPFVLGIMRNTFKGEDFCSFTGSMEVENNSFTTKNLQITSGPQRGNRNDNFIWRNNTYTWEVTPTCNWGASISNLYGSGMHIDGLPVRAGNLTVYGNNNTIKNLWQTYSNSPYNITLNNSQSYSDLYSTSAINGAGPWVLDGLTGWNIIQTQFTSTKEEERIQSFTVQNCRDLKSSLSFNFNTSWPVQQASIKNNSLRGGITVAGAVNSEISGNTCSTISTSSVYNSNVIKNNHTFDNASNTWFLSLSENKYNNNYSSSNCVTTISGNDTSNYNTRYPQYNGLNIAGSMRGTYLISDNNLGQISVGNTGLPEKVTFDITGQNVIRSNINLLAYSQTGQYTAGVGYANKTIYNIDLSSYEGNYIQGDNNSDRQQINVLGLTAERDASSTNKVLNFNQGTFNMPPNKVLVGSEGLNTIQANNACFLGDIHLRKMNIKGTFRIASGRTPANLTIEETDLNGTSFKQPVFNNITLRNCTQSGVAANYVTAATTGIITVEDCALDNLTTNGAANIHDCTFRTYIRPTNSQNIQLDFATVISPDYDGSNTETSLISSETMPNFTALKAAGINDFLLRNMRIVLPKDLSFTDEFNSVTLDWVTIGNKNLICDGTPRLTVLEYKYGSAWPFTTGDIYIENSPTLLKCQASCNNFICNNNSINAYPDDPATLVFPGEEFFKNVATQSTLTGKARCLHSIKERVNEDYTCNYSGSHGYVKTYTCPTCGFKGSTYASGGRTACGKQYHVNRDFVFNGYADATAEPGPQKLTSVRTTDEWNENGILTDSLLSPIKINGLGDGDFSFEKNVIRKTYLQVDGTFDSLNIKSNEFKNYGLSTYVTSADLSSYCTHADVTLSASTTGYLSGSHVTWSYNGYEKREQCSQLNEYGHYNTHYYDADVTNYTGTARCTLVKSKTFKVEGHSGYGIVGDTSYSVEAPAVQNGLYAHFYSMILNANADHGIHFENTDCSGPVTGNTKSDVVINNGNFMYCRKIASGYDGEALGGTSYIPALNLYSTKISSGYIVDASDNISNYKIAMGCRSSETRGTLEKVAVTNISISAENPPIEIDWGTFPGLDLDLDLNAPTIEVLRNPASTTLPTNEVSLTIACRDPDGHDDELPLSINGGAFQATPIRNYKVTENQALTVMARDANGNVRSFVVNITNIDTNGPEIVAINQSNSNWTKDPVTISVQAIDDVKLSAKAYKYEFTPNSAISSDDDGQEVIDSSKVVTTDWTAAKTYRVPDSGTVRVCVRDVMSESLSGEAKKVHETWSDPYYIRNIDKLAPTATVTYSVAEDKKVSAQEGVTVQVSITDTLDPVTMESSGLSSNPILWNANSNGRWLRDEEYTYYENGVYSLRVRDAVGNISAEVPINITQITSSEPVIDDFSGTHVGKEYTTAPVTLRVCARDQSKDKPASMDAYLNGTFDNGLPAKPYSWDGGKTWTSIATKSVYANGEYTVMVRDALGAVKESSLIITNIDSYAPTASIYMYKAAPADWDYSVRQPEVADYVWKLRIEASDLGSGVDTIQTLWDNGTHSGDAGAIIVEIEEPGVYGVIVEDKAGNRTYAEKTITSESIGQGSGGNNGTNGAYTDIKVPADGSAGGDFSSDGKASLGDLVFTADGVYNTKEDKVYPYPPGKRGIPVNLVVTGKRNNWLTGTATLGGLTVPLTFPDAGDAYTIQATGQPQRAYAFFPIDQIKEDVKNGRIKVVVKEWDSQPTFDANGNMTNSPNLVKEGSATLYTNIAISKPTLSFTYNKVTGDLTVTGTSPVAGIDGIYVDKGDGNGYQLVDGPVNLKDVDPSATIKIKVEDKAGNVTEKEIPMSELPLNGGNGGAASGIPSIDGTNPDGSHVATDADGNPVNSYHMSNRAADIYIIGGTTSNTSSVPDGAMFGLAG